MDRKEYLRQYRIKTREHRLEKQRERRLTTKKPCPRCSKFKGEYAKLCRTCAYEAMKGRPSYHWKGGSTRHCQGYIMLYKPDYPRAYKTGYVLEHIFVWETYYNRPLPKGWEVHHYNGIKDDNRPSNLFAKSKREHKLIIPELQKRIQQLEGLLNNQGHLL